MTPTAIFGRYARALVDVVMEQQEEPRVTEELRTYREIFRAVPALRGSLSGATGRTVILNVRSDPELLGGLIVQIGSTVYDGSIRRQLAEMGRQLAGRT